MIFYPFSRPQEYNLKRQSSLGNAGVSGCFSGEARRSQSSCGRDFSNEPLLARTGLLYQEINENLTRELTRLLTRSHLTRF